MSILGNASGQTADRYFLVKLSMGEYKQGFHIDLRADFSGDAAKRDVLTILLEESVDGPENVS